MKKVDQTDETDLCTLANCQPRAGSPGVSPIPHHPPPHAGPPKVSAASGARRSPPRARHSPPAETRGGQPEAPLTARSAPEPRAAAPATECLPPRKRRGRGRGGELPAARQVCGGKRTPAPTAPLRAWVQSRVRAGVGTSCNKSEVVSHQTPRSQKAPRNLSELRNPTLSLPSPPPAKYKAFLPRPPSRLRGDYKSGHLGRASRNPGGRRRTPGKGVGLGGAGLCPTHVLPGLWNAWGGGRRGLGVRAGAWGRRLYHPLESGAD